MPSPARLESGSGSREQEWIADEPEETFRGRQELKPGAYPTKRYRYSFTDIYDYKYL
jgi:hypothetical protein